MLWRRLEGRRRGVWLCRRSVRVSPAGAAPVPPGPAFPWRGSSAWRCRNFGTVVPTGAKPAQLFLCVSPQGYREGKEHPLPEPPTPGGLCHQRPHCATASWLVPPGLALAPLCAGSWRLWVCVSNFKGMRYFLEKNGQIKQKANNTHEGGGFDWGFALDFNQAPRSWARSPALQGPVARGADGRSGLGCCGDTVGRKLRLRPLCLPVGRSVPGVTQQPLSWHCEPLGVTPDSDHPLPGMGRFSLLPAAILIHLSPTPL